MAPAWMTLFAGASLLPTICALLCSRLPAIHTRTTQHAKSRMQARSKLFAVTDIRQDFLHTDEYPDDNYDHILGYGDDNHAPSKLQQITTQRIKDVELSKKPIDTQGCGIDRSFYVSAEDLENEIKEFDEQNGRPLDLEQCLLVQHPKIAIAAEFKRASPSKGDLNLKMDAVEQCLQYSGIGASVISVLTEYKHFKGTLTDMKRVRLATQEARGATARPAILRKDFIIDKYQVLEARANGADTVLLIVAILGVEQLKDLISYCRKFGIEPLVEVHTEQEMEIALDCGAKVIGVNNRNLHTFKLDLDTTAKVTSVAKSRGYTWVPSKQGDGSYKAGDITIAALSGITSSEDVQKFRDIGVGCVLVGETLMKSNDPAQTIADLLSEDTSKMSKKLVKVCGVTSGADASVALQAGANLIGIIFAPKSPRCASLTAASEVVDTVRKYGERSDRLNFDTDLNPLVTRDNAGAVKLEVTPQEWFSTAAQAMNRMTLRRPLTVGVFQNQPVEEINTVIEATGIDVVQLHGNEDVSDIAQINAPCVKVLHVDVDSAAENAAEAGETAVAQLQKDAEVFAGHAAALLLDSRIPGTAGGGTGKQFDWSLAEKIGVPVLLAGGLDSSNVGDAAATKGICGVDVSSGVESQPGVKDHSAVVDFVKNANTKR